MKGFMYQDFIAIKGKYLLAGMAGTFGLLLCSGLLGMDETAGYMLVVSVYMCIWTGVVVGLTELLPERLVSPNETTVTRKWISALPGGKLQYVKEKYLFLGLCDYISYSYLMLVGMLVLVYCPEEYLTKSVMLVQMSVDILFALLVVQAVELPVALCLGRAAAKSILNVIMVLLFLGFFVFLLFGDIALLDRWVFYLADWLQKNPELVMMLAVLTPSLSIGCYGASYKICCQVFQKEGRRHE